VCVCYACLCMSTISLVGIADISKAQITPQLISILRQYVCVFAMRVCVCVCVCVLVFVFAMRVCV